MASNASKTIILKSILPTYGSINILTDNQFLFGQIISAEGKVISATAEIRSSGKNRIAVLELMTYLVYAFPSMRSIQTVLLILAATVASGLLFVNIYTSMVDAPNWSRELPASIAAAREYFSVANPGTFFRLFSPINQVLALASAVAAWWAPKGTFSICVAAFILAVSVDVLTFSYFYPRNEIMFVGPIENVDAIRTALSGWRNMNWIRSGLIAIIVLLDFLALIKVSQRSS